MGRASKIAIGFRRFIAAGGSDIGSLQLDGETMPRKQARSPQTYLGALARLEATIYLNLNAISICSRAAAQIREGELWRYAVPQKDRDGKLEPYVGWTDYLRRRWNSLVYMAEELIGREREIDPEVKEALATLLRSEEQAPGVVRKSFRDMTPQELAEAINLAEAEAEESAVRFRIAPILDRLLRVGKELQRLQRGLTDQRRSDVLRALSQTLKTLKPLVLSLGGDADFTAETNDPKLPRRTLAAMTNREAATLLGVHRATVWRRGTVLQSNEKGRHKRLVSRWSVIRQVLEKCLRLSRRTFSDKTQMKEVQEGLILLLEHIGRLDELVPFKSNSQKA